EHAPAAMDELAAERSPVEAAGEVVGERLEDAEAQAILVALPRRGVHALAAGGREEGVEQRGHLGGRRGMDAGAFAGVTPEVVGGGELPRADQPEEVRGGTVADAVLAEARGVCIDLAQENVPALGEGGEERGMVDAV